MGALYDGLKGHHVPSFSLRGSPPWRAISPRLLLRYTLVAFIISAVAFIHLNGDAVRELRAKYSPTRFGTSSQDAIAEQIATYDWRPFEVGSGTDRPVIQERSLWKRLGAGFEGETFVINDTVIKTFTTSRSPLRNCVPHPESRDATSTESEAMSSSSAGVALHDQSMRWPAEIPAGLVLGGLSDQVSDTNDFVPVKDFFYTPSTKWGLADKWHLLSPLIEGGSLVNLAKRLSTQGNLYNPNGGGSAGPLSYRQLDALFRPSFDRLLAALERMHGVEAPTTMEGGAYNGALCHDDIKLSNIFVANYSTPQGENGPTADSHWLLADLGYVREVTHPYHATRSWLTHLTIPPAPDSISGNGAGGSFYGSADCRINDVMLLMRTYIRFLRLAAVPPETMEGVDGAEQKAESRRRQKEFDEGFWAASEPWSKLYWSVVSERPLAAGSESAKSARDKSTMSYPPMAVDTERDRVMAFMSRATDGKSNTNNNDDNAVSQAAAVAAGIPEGGCWFKGRDTCLARATEEEIWRGFTNLEQGTRILAGVSIFGVPTVECD